MIYVQVYKSNQAAPMDTLSRCHHGIRDVFTAVCHRSRSTIAERLLLCSGSSSGQKVYQYKGVLPALFVDPDNLDREAEAESTCLPSEPCAELPSETGLFSFQQEAMLAQVAPEDCPGPAQAVYAQIAFFWPVTCCLRMFYRHKQRLRKLHSTCEGTGYA